MKQTSARRRHRLKSQGLIILKTIYFDYKSTDFRFIWSYRGSRLTTLPLRSRRQLLRQPTSVLMRPCGINEQLWHRCNKIYIKLEKTTKWMQRGNFSQTPHLKSSSMRKKTLSTTQLWPAHQSSGKCFKFYQISFILFHLRILNFDLKIKLIK